MTGQPPGQRRGTLRTAGAALGLQWRAAPVATLSLLVLTALAGATPTATAWLTKLLLDELARGEAANGDRAVLLAVMTATAGGLVMINLYVVGYLGGALQQRVTVAVEQRLFERVTQFRGLRYFENPRFHDRLRLAEEAAQDAPQSIASFAQELLRGTVVVASFVGVLLVIWWPMALLLLAAGVLAFLARLASARREAAVAEAMSTTYRRRLFYRGLLTEPRAAKEIRLFGLQHLLHGRMVHSLRHATDAVLAAERRGATVQALLAAATAVVTGAGVTVVATGAVRGEFTVGDVTLFLAAVAGMQSAFVGVVLEAGEASRAARLFRHYLDVLDAPDDLPNGAAAPAVLERGIELRDVWFRYDPDGPWVLRGVDLLIPAGSTVGLVGVNGAGKSTLVKLLCRFYDPVRGRILWNGVDLRELDVAELRRRIAVTFQDYMSYDLSAAENIGVGDLDRIRDRDKIRAAACLAEIDGSLAALPHGYDTMLSRVFADDPTLPQAPGVTLSGGQWQRVALARSLLRDRADLLILDEPSAGLDAIAEHRIHRTLHRHGLGRTRLLISHRLSALRDADLIVVLADGTILERGSHDELMSADGHYAAMFTVQAGGYQDHRVRPVSRC